jgi:hypothetical protein
VSDPKRILDIITELAGEDIGKRMKEPPIKHGNKHGRMLRANP